MKKLRQLISAQFGERAGIGYLFSFSTFATSLVEEFHLGIPSDSSSNQIIDLIIFITSHFDVLKDLRFFSGKLCTNILIKRISILGMDSETILYLKYLAYCDLG